MPFDDVEFTSLTNEQTASFIDSTTAGQAGSYDFYRIVAHEIGHALGFSLSNPLLQNSEESCYTEGRDAGVILGNSA